MTDILNLATYYHQDMWQQFYSCSHPIAQLDDWKTISEWVKYKRSNSQCQPMNFTTSIISIMQVYKLYKFKSTNESLWEEGNRLCDHDILLAILGITEQSIHEMTDKKILSTMVSCVNTWWNLLIGTYLYYLHEKATLSLWEEYLREYTKEFISPYKYRNRRKNIKTF